MSESWTIGIAGNWRIMKNFGSLILKESLFLEALIVINCGEHWSRHVRCSIAEMVPLMM